MQISQSSAGALQTQQIPSSPGGHRQVWVGNLAFEAQRVMVLLGMARGQKTCYLGYLKRAGQVDKGWGKSIENVGSLLFRLKGFLYLFAIFSWLCFLGDFLSIGFGP